MFEFLNPTELHTAVWKTAFFMERSTPVGSSHEVRQVIYCECFIQVTGQPAPRKRLLVSDLPVGTRFRTDPGARAQCRISVRTGGHRGQGQTAQGKQEPAARRCARFIRSPPHLISFPDILKGSKVAVG